jgi:hypothetical protein
LAEEEPWVIYNAEKSCGKNPSPCNEQFTGICPLFLDKLKKESGGNFSWKVNAVSVYGTTENETISKIEGASPASDLFCGRSSSVYAFCYK